MPRRKHKKKGWYYNTKFSDKIAIMYGGIFSIIVLVSCVIVTANGVYGFLSMRLTELEEAALKVADVVSEKGPITSKEIEELNLGQNMHIAIFDISNMLVGGNADVLTTALGTPIKVDRMTMKHRLDKRGEFLARFMTCIRPAHYNGDYFLVIAEKPYEKGAENLLKPFITAFIIISAIGVTGSALTGRYLAKMMLKPIINITETAGLISAWDLDRHIEYEGPDDEIKALADTFNDMLRRLMEAFEKQNRFISDASHELRTPLSVIQGYANLIDRWGKEDPEVLKEAITSIKDETEHMSALIKNLLMLCKYQGNTKEMNTAEIDINEAVKEVVREYEVMETGHDIIFECLAGDKLVIMGNFDLIKQMLRIFTDNSIKYSEGGKPVYIKTFAESGYVVIKISDNGIGIDASDIPHIFERFYRADKSRSKEVPGAGIGLCIADTIIRSHQAKAYVESIVGVGTEISVKFPAK